MRGTEEEHPAYTGAPQRLLEQQSSTLLAPGTSFVEESFSTDEAGDDSQGAHNLNPSEIHHMRSSH